VDAESLSRWIDSAFLTENGRDVARKTFLNKQETTTRTAA
jgi:hypothetical protein